MSVVGGSGKYLLVWSISQFDRSGHRVENQPSAPVQQLRRRRHFRIRSPCDENTADALEHRLASLVAQVDLAAKDSRIGSRFRLALL
jgi:hypothetical protein